MKRGKESLKTEPEKNTVCKIRVVMEVSWMYNVAQPSRIISIDGRLQEIILARCGVEVKDIWTVLSVYHEFAYYKINLLNDCS